MSIPFYMPLNFRDKKFEELPWRRARKCRIVLHYALCTNREGHRNSSMNATENFKSYIQNFDAAAGGIGGGGGDNITFGLTPDVPTMLVGITSHEGMKYDENHNLVPSGRYRLAYLFLQLLQGQWCPILTEYGDLYGRRNQVLPEGGTRTFTPKDLVSSTGETDDLWACTRACPGERVASAKAFASLYQEGGKKAEKKVFDLCKEAEAHHLVFAVCGVQVEVRTHKEELQFVSKNGKQFSFQPYLIFRTK